jgi:hypothetical protein
MAKHAFTSHQRYAVFTAHGEVCYLCRKPIDLSSMEVDHIVPESISADPDRLRAVLVALGRRNDFDINSYENWMPSCRSCNRRKSDVEFEPSPIVQVLLQQAADAAPRAREAETEGLNKASLARAINVVQRYAAGHRLDASSIASLRPLLDEGDALRTPEKKGTELNLAPFLRVLRTEGSIMVVQGPHGIGGGPIEPSDAMRCPNCGLQYFNGARCVSCGNLYDD